MMRPIKNPPNLAKRTPFIGFAAVFVAAGLVIILKSFAAGPSTGLEPENGTLTSIQKVSDNTASGGAGIKFGDAPAETFAQGVNAHLLNQDATIVPALLDKMQAAHFKWLRVDVDLSGMPSATQLLPAKVAAMDDVVSQASSRGFKVMFTLKNTPKWEAAGVDDPWPNPNDYASMAELFAKHFAGKVGAWELWNEPNINAFMTPPYPVTPYVNMIKAAYPRIKAADPSALVVVSSAGGVDATFVNAEYTAGLSGHTDAKAGLTKNFDIMGVHPYNSGKDPSTPTSYVNDAGVTTRGVLNLPDIYKIMTLHGDGAVRIWATEWGFSTYQVNEATQATYDVAELHALMTQYAFVTGSFIYSARESTTGDLRADGFGILHNDLMLKPAYTALQNFLK